MTATKYKTPESVDILFGEQVDFVAYCKVNGYKIPKKKDTRPELEKQDIYTVSDSDCTEMVCARSHGHARSIYLNIIGESWDFTGTKLSIKKHSVLKPIVSEKTLSAQLDTFERETIKQLYALGCYLMYMGDYDEDATKLSLDRVLDEDYDDECVYWSIAKKTKDICKKKDKQQK